MVKLDCTIPIAKPVITVGTMKRKLPTNAAPIAGIRKPNVNTVELSWIMGAARMAMNPLTTLARTKLNPARNVGE